MLWQLQKGKGK